MSPSNDPHTPPDAARERALIKVQAASGALFALFLAVHLVNQMVAVAGPAPYDALQGELRRVYQAPVVELALVAAPLLVHIVVSVWRMLRRRRAGRSLPRAARARLQRYSAVVLLIFTFGHILATRGASLIYDVFPGFDGVAYTLVWFFGWFFPYYFIFAVAGLYHLLNGVALALPRLGLRGPGAARSGRIVAAAWLAGAVALLLGLAGFAGVFHEEVRGRAIASPYARMLGELGVAEPVAHESVAAAAGDGVIRARR
jgi:succinate dehydrogenase/fumarate reductase cytochrome b subunit